MNFRLVCLPFLASLCACGARSDIQCLGGVCTGSETGADPDGAAGSRGGDVPIPNLPPPGIDDPTGVVAPPSPEPVRPPQDGPVRLCENNNTTIDATNVTSYAALEELEGCEQITGSLSIFGFETPDLLPLARLRDVTGVLHLGVDGPLTGLEALESVGSLVLSNITAATLEPLSQLTTIGGGREGYISISNATSLTTLSGLGSVNTSGRIEISDNPALRSLAGLRFPQVLEELYVANNTALSDLAGVSNLRTINGRLEITSTALSSLQSLSGLATAERIVIADNIVLTDIGGLGALAELQLLRLANLAITNVDGLSNLSRVQLLRIENNPLLVQIDGFSQATFSELSVKGNSNLSQLPAFSAVTELDTLEVEDNPALLNGPDLPNVASIDQVRIIGNPALTRISALSATRTARNVVIRENVTLTDLDLSSLESFRTLRVFCNATLPEATLEPFRESSAGVVISFGNLGSEQPCSPSPDP